MAAVAVTAVVAPAVVVGTDAVAVVESDESGPSEEDAVHDAKGPGGLEHGARLVGAQVVVGSGDGDAAEGATPLTIPDQRGAVGARDAAQVVDGGDEGANEAQVDESDEAGVGRRAVVAEEGEDGPGEGKDGDDEKEEDGDWGEEVLVVVQMDEPGEHAHSWNLGMVG